MKNKIFLTILIVAFTLSVFGQVENPAKEENVGKGAKASTGHVTPGRRYTLGFTFGTGADWMVVRGDSALRAGAVVNLRYGVPIDINFTKASNYYFTTGLLMHHSGGKTKFDEMVYSNGEETHAQNVTKTRTYRSIYLTIPTGIKLKTPDFKKFVFGVNLGLYHSFRLTSRTVDKFTIGNSETTEKNNKFEKSTALFREAGYLGIGLEYIIKNDFRAYFYMNYAYTFTNYFSKKARSATQDAKLNSVEFVLGCTF